MLNIITCNDLVEENTGKNQPVIRKRLILDKIRQSISNYKIRIINDLIDIEWLQHVHDPEYIKFLKSAYSSWLVNKEFDWVNESYGVIPFCFTRIKPKKVISEYKLSGYYGTDVMTPIYQNTYSNALISANLAQYAAEISYLQAENIIYVLAPIPGHHASYDQYSGYCFFNNAFITAYRAIELGKKKVAILDLDFHAGQGVPKLMSQHDKLKDKIMACSIHGDPMNDYPFFEGFDNDYNNEHIINIPLKDNADWSVYGEVLIESCIKIRKWEPELLIIAFGADTFKEDPDPSPLTRFKLELDDYNKMGQIIRKYFPIPIIVTQEGGYNLDYVPEIVCRFLKSLQEN